MKFGKTDLIRRISDVVRNGWSNVHVRDLIESLWRDPFSMRTSGFVKEGGTDASIDVTAGMEMVDGIPRYTIAFTIAPVNRKFHFYQFRETLSYHKKYTPESITFDATEGLHAVYYDADPDTFEQRLMHIANPTHEDLSELFQWVVPIVFIYYDGHSHEIVYFGDNRHGSWWNPWIHFPWHMTFNSMRETGLRFTDIIADGDGSLDAHAQFGVSAGSCFHEDIHASSAGAAAPAGLPLFYFIAGNLPRIYEESIHCLAVNGLLCYNAGGAVTPATDGCFVMLHVFFTNCMLHPLISVMGQAEYEKVSTASYMLEGEVTAVRNLLPHQNLLLIGTLILQTSADFTNSYHSRIVTFAYGVDSEMSITGDGTKVNKIKLVNDLASPGANKYYGTDSEGVKGYHELDAGGLSSVVTAMSVTGDGSSENPVCLEGDESLPGNWKFYGSNGQGEKGYHPLPSFSYEKDYEFCVEAGEAQSFDLDIYAAMDYVILKAVCKSDGTLEDVAVKIDGIAVTGLDAMDVNTVPAVFIASGNNQVPEGKLVTIHTAAVYSGSPTVLKVKLVYSL